MLIIDGVRYNLWVPKEEKQLEEMVKEHAKEIFGKDSIYFDLKQKLTSKSGVVSIPDGYVISLSKPFEWYVVEVELSNHPLHDHITTQLNNFWVSVKHPNTQRELINALYNEIDNDKLLKVFTENKIGSPEIKGFLYDLISKQPRIVVVIEEKGDKVQEACEGLKVEPVVVEFKTYLREDAPNVHAHLFDSLVSPKIIEAVAPTEKPTIRGELTPQSEYTLPILESLIEISGSGKAQDVLNRVFDKMKRKLKEKDLEKVPSGSGIRWIKTAQWERHHLIEKGYLKKDSPRGVWEITGLGRKFYENIKKK